MEVLTSLDHLQANSHQATRMQQTISIKKQVQSQGKRNAASPKQVLGNKISQL